MNTSYPDESKAGHWKAWVTPIHEEEIVKPLEKKDNPLMTISMLLRAH